jgi:hypothetical protein
MQGLRVRAVVVTATAAAVLLALTGAGAGSGGGAGAAPSLRAPLSGINVEGIGMRAPVSEADRTVALARSLHVKLLRADFPWSVLEQRPGELDPQALAYADRLVSDAAAAGIGVSATVASTPCWASSAPAPILRRCTPGQSSPANAYPPRSAAAYAAFVARLGGRYGPGLAALEVWNEPDQANEDYLAGPNKPAAYAALLRAAYPAVKHADPSLPVLGGSLVGSNGRFLRALYAAGIKGNYDGLSVHFYNLTVASLRSIHEVQLANGDTRPLWLDEFGWTSCWPSRRIEQEQACVTPAVQATNLRDTFRAMARMPYLAAAVVYKLQDSAGEDFGMLSTAGRHKPAFGALAGASAQALGPLAGVRLQLRRRGRSVVAAGSAPVGDFMLLETFQGTQLRYRAVFTLDRFNRYSLTLPSVLGVSGLTVRVYQYGTGPAGGAVGHI